MKSKVFRELHGLIETKSEQNRTLALPVQFNKNKCGNPAPSAKENMARYDLAEQHEVVIQSTFEIHKA